MNKSFYVIRHGETEWNKINRFQGHNDIPLNENGRKQARELKERLEFANDAMIFSSPLNRAKETAEIITESHQEIILMPEFMECNSPEGAKFLLNLKGITEMPTFDDLDEAGESPAELLQRIRFGLNKMQKLGEGRTPYLFAHGGVCVALCHILEIDFFKTPNCGVFYFEYIDNIYKVSI